MISLCIHILHYILGGARRPAERRNCGAARARRGAHDAESCRRGLQGEPLVSHQLLV